MHEVLDSIAQSAAIVAEILAFLFIIVGIVRAILTYVKKTFVEKSESAITVRRNELGHYLSLGLEFLIGADILKTVIAYMGRSWAACRHCWNPNNS